MHTSEIFVRRNGVIEQEALKNLLSAQKRIADQGNATEVIRITKYLLKLADKRADILVNVVPESNQEGRGNPIYQLD